MKTLFSIFILMSLKTVGQSVNLVPNASFEFASYPYYNGFGEPFDSSITNNGVLCWAKANQLVTFYSFKVLSTNYGFSYYNVLHIPHTGNRFADIYLTHATYPDLSDSTGDARSYVQTKLLQPLIANVTYSLSLFVCARLDSLSICNGIINSTKNLGAYFSATRPTDFSTFKRLEVLPQISFNGINFLTDTLIWIQLTGQYQAQGGELYLTIGNFDSYSSTILNYFAHSTGCGSIDTTFEITSLVSIDDISLYPDTATTFINPSILSIGNDTILCDNQPFSDTLTAQAGFFHYLWSNGDTVTSIIITQPGIYWCSVDFGCNWFTDTIRISMDSSFNHFLPADTFLCASQYPYTITAPDYFPNYLWNTGDTTSFITVTQPGTYWLQTVTPCNTHRDSMGIGIYGGVFPGMPDLVWCDGDTVMAYGPPDFSYLWNTGSTDLILQITQAGTYSLSATDVCGTYLDTFQVQSDSSPEINLPEKIVLCEGDVITLDAATGNSVYNWSTGDTTSFISVSASGIYTVKASNGCGLDSITIHVITQNCSGCFATPNAFTPNDDGLNDTWEVIPLCADVKDVQVAIFNRWGEKIFETNDAAQDWDGYFHNKKMEIGTYVFYVTYKAAGSEKQFSQKGAVILLR